MKITKLNQFFSTSSQLNPSDIKEIVSLGFKTIINNRPDHEGGEDQPLNEAIEKTVLSEGLKYAFIPVISGKITREQILELHKAIENFPSPILAFCRSGARSENLFFLATSPEILSEILEKK
tara:strand:+ start:2786 stop:3151 length:366 start_codon:yes stop_codon:yes gene_type:complete